MSRGSSASSDLDMRRAIEIVVVILSSLAGTLAHGQEPDLSPEEDRCKAALGALKSKADPDPGARVPASEDRITTTISIARRMSRSLDAEEPRDIGRDVGVGLVRLAGALDGQGTSRHAVRDVHVEL